MICDRAVATVFLLSMRRVWLRESRPSSSRACVSAHAGWRHRRGGQSSRDTRALAFQLHRRLNAGVTRSNNSNIHHKRLMMLGKNPRTKSTKKDESPFRRDTETSTRAACAPQPKICSLRIPTPIETRSLPALTYALPRISTSTFAHLCRFRPHGSIHPLLP